MEIALQKDLESLVNIEARNNPLFKSKLLKGGDIAKKAIEKKFDIILPKEFKINLIENSVNDITTQFWS